MSAPLVNAPTVETPADAAYWSEFTINNFKDNDTSPKQIVTRTASRIAAKGFELTHILKNYRATENYGWGRSSQASLMKEEWEIGFVDEDQNEFAMFVRVHTNYNVIKRNPYDKKGPDTEPCISFIPKDRETRKALGMSDPE